MSWAEAAAWAPRGGRHSLEEIEIFRQFFSHTRWDCTWTGLQWSQQDGVGLGVAWCICHAHKGTTASRGQTVGSHGGYFTWHRSNQGLSRLMKSISSFSGCSKMGSSHSCTSSRADCNRVCTLAVSLAPSSFKYAFSFGLNGKSFQIMTCSLDSWGLGSKGSHGAELMSVFVIN